MTKLMDKFNKGSKFVARASKESEYKSLKELGASKKVYTVRNLYINKKSKYGDAPVVLIDDCKTLVNLPKHLLETVEEMREDLEVVDAINNGEVGFSVYEYDGKNGSGFSVNWEDIQPDFRNEITDKDLPF